VNPAESVTLRAESDWYRSRSEAENDCDDRLDALESGAISDAASRGGEYVGGSTSGYDITYDSSDDVFKASAERTLNFVFDTNNDLTDFDDSLLPQQDIDVSDTIASKASPFFPPVVRVRIRLPGGGANVNAKLMGVSVQSLEIVSSDLRLGQDIETIGLPSSETIVRLPFDNCGSTEQTLVREFVFEVIRGWKLTFSKKISSKVSIKGSLKFSGFGGEGSFERSTEVTNTQERSEQKRESVRTTHTFKIGANKMVDITLSKQSFEARRRFTGTIVVDGTVLGQYQAKHVERRVISEILSEADRTIPVEGFYGDIDYSEDRTKLTERDCPP
jgi:hypothetical protein